MHVASLLRSRLLTPAIGLLLAVLAISPGRAGSADVPARLTDQEFWRLTEELSEPDGTFRSDNVLSNEMVFARLVPELLKNTKPGGVYLFTVPHFRDRRDTLVRVKVHDADDPSRDEFLTEPEYHGDANATDGRGALSYRSYGTVLDDVLKALGFDVTYTFKQDDVHVIRNCELFYCVKRPR